MSTCICGFAQNIIMKFAPGEKEGTAYRVCLEFRWQVCFGIKYNKNKK